MNAYLDIAGVPLAVLAALLGLCAVAAVRWRRAHPRGFYRGDVDP